MLVIHKADNKKYALKVVKFHESTSEREKDNALAEVNQTCGDIISR